MEQKVEVIPKVKEVTCLVSQPLAGNVPINDFDFKPRLVFPPHPNAVPLARTKVLQGNVFCVGDGDGFGNPEHDFQPPSLVLVALQEEPRLAEKIMGEGGRCQFLYFKGFSFERAVLVEGHYGAVCARLLGPANARVAVGRPPRDFGSVQCLQHFALVLDFHPSFRFMRKLEHYVYRLAIKPCARLVNLGGISPS